MRSTALSIIIALVIILGLGGGAYLLIKKFTASADVESGPKSADLNSDQKVDALDLNILIRAISEKSENMKYDINNDGAIDNLDQKALMSQWTK